MKEDLRFDITIEAGSDYPLDISYTDDDDNPVDLTGWIVDGTIREATGDYDGYPFKTWADANGFHLFISKEHTRGITFTRGIWDMFITTPDRRTRTKLLHGRVTVVPNTARRWR